jgi:hypothetical protein
MTRRLALTLISAFNFMTSDLCNGDDVSINDNGSGGNAARSALSIGSDGRDVGARSNDRTKSRYDILAEPLPLDEDDDADE